LTEAARRLPFPISVALPQKDLEAVEGLLVDGLTNKDEEVKTVLKKFDQEYKKNPSSDIHFRRYVACELFLCLRLNRATIPRDIRVVAAISNPEDSFWSKSSGRWRLQPIMYTYTDALPRIAFAELLVKLRNRRARQ
jgi:hypothetical protein